jgi:hypothetical protein
MNYRQFFIFWSVQSVAVGSINEWPPGKEPTISMRRALEIVSEVHTKEHSITHYPVKASALSNVETDQHSVVWNIVLGDTSGTTWRYEVTSDLKVQLRSKRTESDRLPDPPVTIVDAFERLHQGIIKLGFSLAKKSTENGYEIRQNETKYLIHSRLGNQFNPTLSEVIGPDPSGVVVRVSPHKILPGQDYWKFINHQPYWNEYHIYCGLKSQKDQGIKVEILTGLDLDYHTKFQIAEIIQGTFTFTLEK